MAVKHIDTYSKKWSVALIGTVTWMYLIFILPLHTAAVGFLYPYVKFYGFQSSDVRLGVFLLITFCLVMFLLGRVIHKQNKNIKAFTKFFREKHFHEPSSVNVAKSWTGLSYLSFDTKNGTLLYINHPDTTVFNFFTAKDVRVMGFGISDWRAIDVVGKTLTIYTGNPDLPSVSIHTAKANELYEKINAMRNEKLDYEFSTPGYVEHQAKLIAESNGINLILPPR